MAWWFKKKQLDEFLTSAEFKSLEKKNVEFSSAIDILKQKMDLTETNFRSIRGKLNQHILREPQEEEKVTPKEEEKTENSIKPTVFLNPNGLPISN